MPEYPLLPLPDSERGASPKIRGFRSDAKSLSPGRQGERLGPIFQRLASVLDSGRDDLSLLSDPSSIAPERALVLEVVGPPADFQALVARAKGLEFLGDEEASFKPDEDFFEPDKRKGKDGEPRTDRPIKGRLYLALPDLEALRQLVSLWRQWQNGERLPRGFTQWQDVVERLRAIRPWGPADRLSDETVSFWSQEAASGPKEMRRIEVELWFRGSAVCR